MYIHPNTLSNQSVPAPGLLELTPEQERMYLQYNGFIRIVSTSPMEIEPDVEAWEVWKASDAEKMEPTPKQTIDERVTALESAIERGLSL